MLVRSVIESVVLLEWEWPDLPETECESEEELVVVAEAEEGLTVSAEMCEALPSLEGVTGVEGREE